MHDHDAVGQRHRFFLIVRDVERGDAEPLLQRAEFVAHLRAQPGVEIGQRLVEQQHFRLEHQRARNRDALLLAAGQARRRAVGIRLHLDQPQRALDLLADLGLGLRRMRSG